MKSVWDFDPSIKWFQAVTGESQRSIQKEEALKAITSLILGKWDYQKG